MTMENPKIKKRTFSREEKYSGFPENPIYWNSTGEIENLQKEIKKHQEKIDEMQRNCIHQYKFWSSGVYDDVFACSECGHMIES